MPNGSIGRNSPCPCGSGRKFKQCCQRKGYEFAEDEQGTIRRSIPISDELDQLLGSHLDGLANDLGRDLVQDDPLFPDQHLEHVEHDLVQAMEKVGVDPAIIYAFEKTGLLVSQENQHLISDMDLDAWEDAIREFKRLNGQGPEQYPVGTVAFYGPDDQRTTKIVAAVIADAHSKPILERFVGTNISEDPKVHSKIAAFFASHQVTTVTHVDQNIGCPHEEGQDFPQGEDCPFCPFWKGKQGSNSSL